MADPPLLPAGANLPLGGTRVRITLTGPRADGLALLAEPPLRVLPASDAAVCVLPTGVVEIELARTGGLRRVRVVSWAAAPLTGLGAAVDVAGEPLCAVGAEDGLRAVELVELYQRGDAWKIRAVGSGWAAGRDALAASLGLAADAFVPFPVGVNAGASDPALRSGGRRAGRGLRPPGAASSPPSRPPGDGRDLRGPAPDRPRVPRPGEVAARRGAARGTPPHGPDTPTRDGRGLTPPNGPDTPTRDGRGLTPPNGPDTPTRDGRGLTPPNGPDTPTRAGRGLTPPNGPDTPTRDGRGLTPPGGSGTGSPATGSDGGPSRSEPRAGRTGGGGHRRDRGGLKPPTPAPIELRQAVDQLVGAGPRGGGGDHVTFTLGAVPARAALTRLDAGAVVLDVAIELGSLTLNERVAEAALQAAGSALCGRICLADGRAHAAASAALHPVGADAGALVTLFRDAWATGRAFAAAANLVGEVRARADGERPRVLRRASPGRFAPLDTWDATRSALLAAGWHPLVDAPWALQAPRTADGEDGSGSSDRRGDASAAAAELLRVGPVQRAEGAEDPVWVVATERLLLGEPAPEAAHGWTTLAQANRLDEPVRTALVPEPGRGARPALMSTLATLALGSRPSEALLGTVRARVLARTPEAAITGQTGRTDLPWPRGRPWDGPGRGPTLTGLAREVGLLAPGIPAPVELPDRVAVQGHTLDRATIGWLAHLALARAEAEGPATGWDDVARGLVEQVPPEPTATDPTLASSLARRLSRLSPGQAV